MNILRNILVILHLVDLIVSLRGKDISSRLISG